MSLNTILRQKQIREMLDYDIVQNKRVFDSEIKHVETMNEAEAPPRKSDIEFEAEVKSNVESIVLQFQRLINSINSLESLESNIPKVISSPEFYDDEGQSQLPGTGDVANLSDFEGYEGLGRFKNGVIKGGNKELELTKFLQRIKDNTMESISGIYSSFNGLVDKINSKLKNGYSSQGTSNIISLLQPIADNASEVLAVAYSLKNKGLSWSDFDPLYQKIYSLIIEIIDIIKQAPPLRRLDATRIRDDHYQGDYEQPDIRPLEDVRKRENEIFMENSGLNAKIGDIKILKNQINAGIRQLTKMLEQSPGHEGIIRELQNYEEYRDELDRRITELEYSIDDNIELQEKIRESDIADIEFNIHELEGSDTDIGLIGKLEADKKILKKQRISIKAGIGIRGRAREQALKGIDRKLERLETQISKANIALARNKKLLKDYREIGISEREPLDIDVDNTELPEITNQYVTPVSLDRRDKPPKKVPRGFTDARIREEDVVDVLAPGRPGVLPELPQPQPQELPKQQKISRNPLFNRLSPGTNEADWLRSKVGTFSGDKLVQGFNYYKYLRDEAIGKGDMDKARQEQSKLDSLFSDGRLEAILFAEGNVPPRPEEIRPEGFGKRRGRPSKKGGAKAMSPDQINAVVVARNKAFAANNEATQLPRAPMTYLGLKADNTRGTLGAGKKKDIVMKQKDFVKEHKKLVSLLGKTANSLKSEAVEQTDELGKFDPETAKVLEKTIQKEKLKAGKKGKKSTKQLPTLVFDDKKNDWFI